MVKLIRWSVICGTRSAVRRREVVHWASYSTFTALHYTILPYITLHYLTLHNTTSPYITINYLTLHYTSLLYSAVRYTTSHYTNLPGVPRVKTGTCTTILRAENMPLYSYSFTHTNTFPWKDQWAYSLSDGPRKVHAFILGSEKKQVSSLACPSRPWYT